jgi:hypothetical protein
LARAATVEFGAVATGVVPLLLVPPGNSRRVVDLDPEVI